MNPSVTVNGNGRVKSNAYVNEGKLSDVGADIFNSGMCLRVIAI
jgi:hypothetical protein